MDVGNLSIVLLFYILLFHFLIDALGIFGCFLRLSIISMWTVTGFYIKSLYVTWGIFLSLSGVGLPLFWMDIWVPIFRCENVMTLLDSYTNRCHFSWLSWLNYGICSNLFLVQRCSIFLKNQKIKKFKKCKEGIP